MKRIAFVLAASLLALSACNGGDDAVAQANKAREAAEKQAAAATAAQLLRNPEEVVGTVAGQVGLTSAPAVESIGQAARAAVATAGRTNQDATKALGCTNARMEQDVVGIAANC